MLVAGAGNQRCLQGIRRRVPKLRRCPTLGMLRKFRLIRHGACDTGVSGLESGSLFGAAIVSDIFWRRAAAWLH